MTIDERQQWMWDAHHEAGHVVRAVAWQYPVELSTTEYWNALDDARHGFTEHMTFHPSKWTAFDYCKAICIATAGTVAEGKFRRGRRSILTEDETRDLAWSARGDNQDIHEFRA